MRPRLTLFFPEDIDYLREEKRGFFIWASQEMFWSYDRSFERYIDKTISDSGLNSFQMHSHIIVFSDYLDGSLLLIMNLGLEFFAGQVQDLVSLKSLIKKDTERKGYDVHKNSNHET